jgi:hypothetical protein
MNIIETSTSGHAYRLEDIMCIPPLYWASHYQKRSDGEKFFRTLHVSCLRHGEMIDTTNPTSNPSRLITYWIEPAEKSPLEQIAVERLKDQMTVLRTSLIERWGTAVAEAARHQREIRELRERLGVSDV